MAEINKGDAATAQGQKNFWPIIGKAWNNVKNGKNFVSIRIGNQRDPFKSITLKPGDNLVLTPNNKRPNKRDADHLVCVAPATQA